MHIASPQPEPGARLLPLGRRKRNDGPTRKSGELGSPSSLARRRRGPCSGVRYEQELEEMLARERDRLMREQLANHPSQTADDFLRHAWLQLRRNLIEDREREQMAAMQPQLRATGAYDL
jgi:hypothetical protein